MNIVNGVRLQWFSRGEFTRRAVAGGTLIDWSDSMDRRLLLMADALRNIRGERIVISNGDGVLGRYVGESYHSITYWGTVMAMDVIPDGVKCRADAEKFYYQAKQLGFGGIGVYPQWHQGIGFHLDSRASEPYRPATWGRVNGKYVSLQEALKAIPS